MSSKVKELQLFIDWWMLCYNNVSLKSSGKIVAKKMTHKIYQTHIHSNIRKENIFHI